MLTLRIKPIDETEMARYESRYTCLEPLEDSGIDLYSTHDIEIGPMSQAFIEFGFASELIKPFPDGSGYENLPYWLMPRSSISGTTLRMSNSMGLIDAGYRGQIMASVDNMSRNIAHVKTGTKLFQLVSMTGQPMRVEVVKELSESSRGTGGFGSTGQ